MEEDLLLEKELDFGGEAPAEGNVDAVALVDAIVADPSLVQMLADAIASVGQEELPVEGDEMIATEEEIA